MSIVTVISCDQKYRRENEGPVASRPVSSGQTGEPSNLGVSLTCLRRACGYLLSYIIPSINPYMIIAAFLRLQWHAACDWPAASDVNIIVPAQAAVVLWTQKLIKASLVQGLQTIILRCI